MTHGDRERRASALIDSSRINGGAPIVPCTVLFVDDDPVTRDAFPELIRLRLPQVSVDTCWSAAHALERLGQADYAAIVADIRMPGLSGIDLLRYARQLRPCVPVLLATGLRDVQVVQQALTGGVFDFFFKPIDRQDAVSGLQLALEYHRLSHWYLKQQAQASRIEQRLKRLAAFIERHEGKATRGLERVKEIVSKVLIRTHDAVRMHQAAHVSTCRMKHEHVWIKFASTSSSGPLKGSRSRSPS